MKTTLTKIGNSKGVIIPEHFLEECQFGAYVSIALQEGYIVISKPNQPRSDWAADFDKVPAEDQELLIDDTMPNKFDDEDWKW